MSNSQTLLRLLCDHGVIVVDGLPDTQLDDIERKFGFRFPPDLRALLRAGLPIGERFLDWREPDAPAIANALAWPLEGMLFDVEQSDFWLEAWGARPAGADQQRAVVTASLASAPRLIPIYGHRYIPALPFEVGNPIFSVYQTDIICYGRDLEAYFALEHRLIGYEEATRAPVKQIPFWSELVS